MPNACPQETYFKEKISIVLISTSDRYKKSTGKNPFLSLKFKYTPLKRWRSERQACCAETNRLGWDAFWKCFLTGEPHPVIDSFAQKTFASKSSDKLLSVPMSGNEAFPPKLGIKGNRAALGEPEHEINAEGISTRRGSHLKAKGGFYTQP